MSMINGARNPQGLVNMLMQNNPQMQEINKLIQQAGGDGEKAFRMMAQQKGLNPDEAVSIVKNNALFK